MRRFKYFFMSLILVTCMLGASNPVSASSYSIGKAIIPSYLQDTTGTTSYTISNITDQTISITITLYNPAGAVLTDDNNINTGKIIGSTGLSSYVEQASGSTVTFTLAAHATGFIALTNTASNFGYGVIQWSQSGTQLQGLVVQGWFTNTTSGGRFSIPVNNGMPF